MLVRRLFVFLFCLLSLSSAAAQSVDNIIVTGAWVRATVSDREMASEAGGVSGAYMTIANESETPFALVAASTPAAGLVEIHETQMTNGVMRMNPIERLELQPGESAVLEPGGFHIMLMDLARGLAPGDAISLTLTFEPLVASAARRAVPLELVIGLPVLDAPPLPSDFILTDVWARPTSSDILGASVEARPTAEGGVVSPEHHAATTPHAEEQTISDVSAVYFQLTNLGEPDRLVSAATEVAGLVEIHETQMANGVMRMNPVDGLEVLTEERLVLEPGGLHIMLMDLQRPLLTGDAFIITLTFESGRTLEVAVPVYDRLLLP
jgi:copper(I)-binding protein